MANSPKKKPHNKFQDALEILNTAAKEKQEDLYHALEGEYKELKQSMFDAMNGVGATGKAYLEGARKRAQDTILSGEEQLKNLSDALESKVRENPLVYLSAGMLAAFILGYTVSQSRRYTAAVPVKREEA